MTRTTLSIRFVLILTTVIGIHGNETPREAILTLKNDFEDGLSDREFRVDFAGVDIGSSATIKIFKKGDEEPRVDYTIPENAEKPQLLHFELKKEKAPAGSYEVQVCIPGKECSARRPAMGKILSDEDKQTLSCSTLADKQENEFVRYSGVKDVQKVSIKINKGIGFLTPDECTEKLPAFSDLKLKSNPAYKIIDEKKVFYAAVWYDGKHLDGLFKQIKGYCSRKYIFWASAHVVEKATNVVKRRYRGTIIITEALAQAYILNSGAKDFPVEFARYDEERLTKGDYYVSVSFCASDKDRINSSICSEAIYSNSDLEFE